MRGCLKQRYKGSWSIILDLGYETDPATGKARRKQKWHTFRGNRKDAEDKLTDLLKAVKDGAYVDVSKLTLGQWLKDWLAASKRRFRPSTYTRFSGIIENDLLKAPIAGMLLQKVRSTHIEQYYAAAKVSSSTLTLHHTILHQAFRKAAKDRLIVANVAVDLDGKPRRSREKVSGDAQKHAWTAQEARAFLKAAKAAGRSRRRFTRSRSIAALARVSCVVCGGVTSISTPAR
jgi:integrase-like protein